MPRCRHFTIDGWEYCLAFQQKRAILPHSFSFWIDFEAQDYILLANWGTDDAS